MKQKKLNIAQQNKLDFDTGPTYAEVVCKRISELCDSRNVKRLKQTATIKDIVKISYVLSQK